MYFELYKVAKEIAQKEGLDFSFDEFWDNVVDYEMQRLHKRIDTAVRIDSHRKDYHQYNVLMGYDYLMPRPMNRFIPNPAVA